jgi:hypothetical protein
MSTLKIIRVPYEPSFFLELLRMIIIRNKSIAGGGLAGGCRIPAEAPAWGRDCFGTDAVVGEGFNRSVNSRSDKR